MWKCLNENRHNEISNSSSYALHCRIFKVFFVFLLFLYYFLFIIIGKLESKAATSSTIFYVFAVTFYLFWMHFHYLIRLGGPLSSPSLSLSLSLLGATEQRGEAKESHPTKKLWLDEILLRRRCGHRDPRRIGGFTAALLLHYPGRAHLHNGKSRLDGCGGARRNGAWQRWGKRKKTRDARAASEEKRKVN